MSSDTINLIFDEKGKVTSQRIIEVTNVPKIESSITAIGVMRGETITDMSTYTTVPKHDGTLRADGNGVLTITTSGGEMATYTFQAIGQTSPNGGLEARGALIISSMPNGKLAFLNNTVGVFKTEIDSMGNTHTLTWSIDIDRIGK